MSLPMRPTDCFEAGRQTQTESSVKAPGRMRQMDVWSRDPLTCWTWIPNADGAKTLNSTQPRRAVLSGGLRGTAFPLDRYLSWMSIAALRWRSRPVTTDRLLARVALPHGPPQAAARLCASPSHVHRLGPTPRGRAWRKCGLRLLLPVCRRSDRHRARPPGSRAESFLACLGSSTAQGLAGTRVSAPVSVAFRTGARRRHPGRGYFTAQYPTRQRLCQRFTCNVAIAGA
jgi:hypothetical protein